MIGADRIDATTWNGLADVCRQTPAPSVILIQHQIGLERTERDLLSRERAFRSVEPAAFHAWGERFEAACMSDRDVHDAQTEKRRFPAVPDDEIPYFRAACRAALSTADFRIVDTA